MKKKLILALFSFILLINCQHESVTKTHGLSYLEKREKLQKKMEKVYTKYKKYVNSLEGEVATAYKYA